MFKPAPMLHLSALVLERDERPVLRHLGKLGVMHLTRATAEPSLGLVPAKDCGPRLNNCERLLTRLKDIRNTLGTAPAEKPGILAPGLDFPKVEEFLNQFESRIEELLKRRKALLEGASDIEAICHELNCYQGLEIPIDDLNQSEFLHFVTGSLPSGNLAHLQVTVGDNVAVIPLVEQNGRQLVIALTTRAGKRVLEQSLQEWGFKLQNPPPLQGATPETFCAAKMQEQRGLAEQTARLDADWKKVAEESEPVLAEYERLLNSECELLRAEQSFVYTDDAVLLTGWIPAADASCLEQQLRDITRGRCVLETAEPNKEQEQGVPVLLRHSRLLRPFGMLVTAFGFPKYGELEPTFFVAITYLLMFGMMFGDVGHGAVLVMSGVWLLITGRTLKLRDFGRLLLFGGFSSMVFGAAYGSCFGLSQFKKYAIWHDPIEGDPMSVIRWAVAYGIAMISLGVILNIVNRLRNHDLIEGLMDKFGLVGIVFYWGVLLLITRYDIIQTNRSWKLALFLILGVILLLWALKGPVKHVLRQRKHHKLKVNGGLMADFTESFVEAFEGLLSYLANTISFMRLAAYAMSHAALLAAGFVMAAEVKHFAPGGGVLSIVVIVAANVIAIVLEGIIAAVQALRLEYYEFFGKFFSGGGQPFKPFRLSENILPTAAMPSQ